MVNEVRFSFLRFTTYRFQLFGALCNIHCSYAVDFATSSGDISLLTRLHDTLTLAVSLGLKPLADVAVQNTCAFYNTLAKTYPNGPIGTNLRSESLEALTKLL